MTRIATALAALIFLLHPAGASTADCNQNGIDDAGDIAAETSADCNGNGLPDECEAALPDDNAVTPQPSVSFVEKMVSFDRFEPHSSALVDLDRDGWLDMVTMDGEDRVMTLRNDRSGALVQDAIYTLAGMDEIIWITTADFDGDGDPDIAAVDEKTDFLAVLLNRGDGTFEQTPNLLDPGSEPQFLAAADFDRDGDIDLACVDRSGNAIPILDNRGDAVFSLKAAPASGQTPVGVAAGDFDGRDGPDLAVVTSTRLAILLNQGDGSFGERVSQLLDSPRFVTAADMDSDGDLDLAIAQEGADRLSVFVNDGAGAFTLAASIPLGRAPRSVVVADIDGNGLPDLVSGNELSDSISLVFQRELLVFDAPRHRDVGADPRFVVTGDLDRDDDIDVVVANHTSYDLSVLYTSATELWSPPYSDSVCTLRDFGLLSRPSQGDGALRRYTRFLLPRDVQDPEALAPLIANARFDSMLEFLDRSFPGRFPDLDAASYAALVGVRATRKHWSGTITQLDLDGEARFGFTVDVSDEDDPQELPTPAELRSIHAMLRPLFPLAEVAWFPSSAPTRALAMSSSEIDIPVLLTGAPFRRGDVDASGEVAISDPIALLEHLFRGTFAPTCDAAADANDDGSVDVSDVVRILLRLFADAEPLPAPFAGCGIDATIDALPCAEFAACVGGIE